MKSKPWWASKTVWANALMVAAAVSAAFGIPNCSEVFNPDDFCVPLSEQQQAAITGGIMGVVNFLLRLWTIGPMRVMKEK